MFGRKMPVQNPGTPQPLSVGDEAGERPDFRQMCRYGTDCYQKNPMHHQKFRHPKDGGEEEKPAEKTDGEPAEKKPRVDDVEKKIGEKPAEKNVPESNVKAFETDFEPCQSCSDMDPVKRVETVYLTKFPADFIAFWEFCKSLNLENPREALAKTCNLRLVGPYDFVTHKVDLGSDYNANDVLCHYRYHADVPEFQTVLASTKADVGDKFRIGYFRDEPGEDPGFVAAAGMENSGCKLVMLGDNLFGALFNRVAQLIKNAEDPFKVTALQKLKESIHIYATMKNQDQSFSLEAKTTRMKSRDKKKLGSPFHGAGIVVPYNKDTMVGYREVPESNPSIRRMMDKLEAVHADPGSSDDDKNRAFDPLQELVTNVQFANDEGDPGMGLELGLDALLHGGRSLHSTCKHLLSVAYDLLGREKFAKILAAHLSRRSQDKNFFALDI